MTRVLSIRQIVSASVLVVLTFLSYVPSVFAVDANQYICTTQSIVKMPEDAVVNLLFLMKMAQASAQGKESGQIKDVKREQCGLPGEEWRVCTKCTEKIDQKAYDAVAPLLASAGHREWHFNWHAIRNQFSADGIYDMPPSQKQVEGWQKSGWIEGDDVQFKRDHSFGGKLAGEDFFFMHRQMIKMLQVEMAAKDGACIKPWSSLPHSPRKEDAEKLKEMKEKIAALMDPKYLKSVSLSQLGNDIDSKVHRELHVLYADTVGKCKDPNKDNAVTCNNLDHDRSAPVNTQFWKLHGFVDDMMGKWLDANGYQTIRENCEGVERCYQWKGTWMGNQSAMNGG